MSVVPLATIVVAPAKGAVALAFPTHALALAPAHQPGIVCISTHVFWINHLLLLALTELTTVSLLTARRAERRQRGGGSKGDAESQGWGLESQDLLSCLT